VCNEGFVTATAGVREVEMASIVDSRYVCDLEKIILATKEDGVANIGREI
jgi:hypothetical protein